MARKHENGDHSFLNMSNIFALNPSTHKTYEILSNNTLVNGIIIVIEKRLKQLGDCWLTWDIFYIKCKLGGSDQL